MSKRRTYIAAEVRHIILADDGDDNCKTDNDDVGDEFRADDTDVEGKTADLKTVLGEILDDAGTSSDEEDAEIMSKNATDTESELSETDADTIESGSNDVWVGKDNTVWSKQPVRLGKTPVHNMVTSATRAH
jgi:hypothetical protein